MSEVGPGVSEVGPGGSEVGPGHYGLRAITLRQKKLRPRFSIMGMPETCTVAYADESYIGFYVRPGPFKAILLSPK